MPAPFSIVYLNGKYLDRRDAMISPDDRGFLLGEGVFDTLRGRNGVFFRFADHYKRLSSGVTALKIAPAFDEAGLGAILLELLTRNATSDAIARVTVTRGVGGGGFRVNPEAIPTVYAALREAPNETRLRSLGIIMTISATMRPPGFLGANGPIFKTTSLGAMAMARMTATSDEMILLDQDGLLAEGTSSSVLIVKNDRIFAPPLSRVLPGITRSVIGEIVAIEERPIAVDEILSADAVIAATSSMGPIPVARIDERSFPIDHPLIRRIIGGYDELVRSECGAPSHRR